MNLRPSGYEPDELPTAPPRDISLVFHCGRQIYNDLQILKEITRQISKKNCLTCSKYILTPIRNHKKISLACDDLDKLSVFKITIAICDFANRLASYRILENLRLILDLIIVTIYLGNSISSPLLKLFFYCITDCTITPILVLNYNNYHDMHFWRKPKLRYAHVR